MKLLLATDHTFIRHHSGVYDTFCFDKKFFDDYIRVFDSIEVVCRMKYEKIIPIDAFKSDGDDVEFVDIPNVHGLSWLLVSGYLSRKILNEKINRSDAVIVRVPSELGWHTARMARRQEKPYLIEVIGDPLEAIRCIKPGIQYKLLALLQASRLKNMANLAEGGSYVSNYLRHVAYPMDEPKESATISSIRLASNKIASYRTYPPSIKKIKIIQVGSLTSLKRSKDLLLAGKLLVEKGYKVEIHLVGDGPERQNLDSLTQSYGMENHIIFHGHISNKQKLEDLLDATNIFVLTSASEGLPRVVLEAMARGLPVLGTQIAGLDDLVDDTERYPVGDISTLSKILITLINNPERLTKLSKHSIETAQKYTNDILSEKRYHLYRFLRSKAEQNTQTKDSNFL